ncbi:hypothetical protein [Streptomyces sp. NPDC057557]|uniref:hypothetical protein n=1 Tax=Streptomyces sp. NPDC057557 TaxID=3346167 RepID=UPI00369EC801
MPSDTTARVVAADICGIRLPTSRRLDCSDAMNPDPDRFAACLHVHERFGYPVVIRDGHSLSASVPGPSATRVADSLPTYTCPHAAFRPAIGAARWPRHHHGGVRMAAERTGVHPRPASI